MSDGDVPSMVEGAIATHPGREQAARDEAERDGTNRRNKDIVYNGHQRIAADDHAETWPRGNRYTRREISDCEHDDASLPANGVNQRPARRAAAIWTT
jgi:hypothetical protein